MNTSRFRQNPSGPDAPDAPDAPSASGSNPLDDDPELANIGALEPTPIAKPDPTPASIAHVPPLGPLTDIDPQQGDVEEPLPVDTSNVGAEAGIPEAAPVVPLGSDPHDHGSHRIRTFEQRLTAGHGESHWKRLPTPTGTHRGACHVRSFHCKLTGDSLEFLDNQINEWLDAHPKYEVKMVTTSVGEWSGKLKEPVLIVNVWV